jgi:hypothetical protein
LRVDHTEWPTGLAPWPVEIFHALVWDPWPKGHIKGASLGPSWAPTRYFGFRQADGLDPDSAWRCLATLAEGLGLETRVWKISRQSGRNFACYLYLGHTADYLFATGDRLLLFHVRRTTRAPEWTTLRRVQDLLNDTLTWIQSLGLPRAAQRHCQRRRHRPPPPDTIPSLLDRAERCQIVSQRTGTQCRG